MTTDSRGSPHPRWWCRQAPRSQPRRYAHRPGRCPPTTGSPRPNRPKELGSIVTFLWPPTRLLTGPILNVRRHERQGGAETVPGWACSAAARWHNVTGPLRQQQQRRKPPSTAARPAARTIRLTIESKELDGKLEALGKVAVYPASERGPQRLLQPVTAAAPLEIPVDRIRCAPGSPRDLCARGRPDSCRRADHPPAGRATEPGSRALLSERSPESVPLASSVRFR